MSLEDIASPPSAWYPGVRSIIFPPHSLLNPSFILLVYDATNGKTPPPLFRFQNCTFKPPSASTLPFRLRRLCPTCVSAPLALLTPPSLPHSPLFCTCAVAVYLCQPCGASSAERDAVYLNTRTVLARYGVMKSGRWGTGIDHDTTGGHADAVHQHGTPLWPEESVRCWRGSRCLAAKEVEVEVEVEAQGAQDRGNAGHSAGYWYQEIEGVGGVMKAKRRVKLGVGDWVKGGGEPQRGGSSGRHHAALDPDEARSWCGWCERVVLGRKDEEMMTMSN